MRDQDYDKNIVIYFLAKKKMGKDYLKNLNKFTN